MKILAFEFSSTQRSIAVIDQSLAGRFETAEMIETGGKTAKPFEMVEECLRQTHLEREQIECVAVALGPGSYNGIRSSISLAQGWQLASGTKLLGISSVDCLVKQAKEAGLLGRLNIVIDAQRNEFYLATYELEMDQVVPVIPLKLATMSEIQELHRAGERIAGPEVTRWFSDSLDLVPRASALGQIALSRRDYVSGETLEPIYLREAAFVKAPRPRIAAQ